MEIKDDTRQVVSKDTKKIVINNRISIIETEKITIRNKRQKCLRIIDKQGEVMFFVEPEFHREIYITLEPS